MGLCPGGAGRPLLRCSCHYAPPPSLRIASTCAMARWSRGSSSAEPRKKCAFARKPDRCRFQPARSNALCTRTPKRTIAWPEKRAEYGKRKRRSPRVLCGGRPCCPDGASATQTGRPTARCGWEDSPQPFTMHIRDGSSLLGIRPRMSLPRVSLCLRHGCSRQVPEWAILPFRVFLLRRHCKAARAIAIAFPFQSTGLP